MDLDDELTRESGKTREMEAEAREESVRRERAELVVRHLEEERAKAGEAEARRRPAARTRKGGRIARRGGEARSRSPEGTSPREVGDETFGEGLSASGDEAKLVGNGRSRRPEKRVAEVVEEARARGAPPPETRRPVQHVAEVVEEARVKVNMAALAPRPTVETRAESVQSQPPKMDPHDALLNRLTKNKPQEREDERARGCAAGHGENAGGLEPRRWCLERSHPNR